MNKKLQELAYKSGYDFYPDGRQTQLTTSKNLEKFAELLIQELAKAVDASGKQCAFTTYDLSVVECTIAKCKDAVQNYLKDNE